MDELKNNPENKESYCASGKKDFKGSWQAIAIIFIVLFGISVLSNFFDTGELLRRKSQSADITEGPESQVSGEEDEYNKLLSVVLPEDGIELPVVWGSLGKQLVDGGVIDEEKLETLYSQRGGLDEEMKRLLEQDGEKIVMTEQNASTLLNILWALGLANKNTILDNGPMQDSKYGGAGNFASTGGWTLARDDAMDHYSKHKLIELTDKQQELVENVSKGIFRPCCGNSTYFPDCNHGMAMLGLLELMASQGANEEEMYKVALQVNAYWFPETYLTIAKYMKSQGVEWSKVDPKLVLGESFSSASGYRRILAQVEPVQSGGGGGCGV